MSDPVLQGLALLANKGNLTISLTLFADGKLVQGTLTSVDQWKESFGANLQESALMPGLGAAAAATEDAFVHIKVDRIYGSGDMVDYNADVVLRFSLDAISGWHFGMVPKNENA